MQYKKLSIDFPEDEFIYLKMACAKLDMSIKDFVTRSVIRSVEDLEDELDIKHLSQARKEIAEHPENLIDWDELEQRLGWNKL